jgi:hypothetical protein
MESLNKIEYTKKGKLNLTAENASQQAIADIAGLADIDSVVLRVRINSPVFVEAAAPLTTEGIKKVCNC